MICLIPKPYFGPDIEALSLRELNLELLGQIADVCHCSHPVSLQISNPHAHPIKCARVAPRVGTNRLNVHCGMYALGKVGGREDHENRRPAIADVNRPGQCCDVLPQAFRVGPNRGKLPIIANHPGLGAAQAGGGLSHLNSGRLQLLIHRWRGWFASRPGIQESKFDAEQPGNQHSTENPQQLPPTMNGVRKLGLA